MFWRSRIHCSHAANRYEHSDHCHRLLMGVILAGGGLSGALAASSCTSGVSAALTTNPATTIETGQTLTVDYCFRSGSTLDLYAAVVLPDQTVLFFTGVGATPTFSTTLAPFQRNAPVQDGRNANLLSLTWPSGMPTGRYGFYTVAVAPGESPLDATKWLGRTLASTYITAQTTAAHHTETPMGSGPFSAFFYQTVEPKISTVRAGVTRDGQAVDIYNVNLVDAKNGTFALGDPVFSRLSNGKWAMTSWGKSDTFGLHYYEGNCPVVDNSNIKSLPASSASGCQRVPLSAMAKTSQVFEVEGSNYLFTHINSEIYLTRLTQGSTKSATELSSVCVRQTNASKLSELGWGESSRVITKEKANNLLLSDTGIARRKDGTWVLFVKGIAKDSGCAPTSTCELCARHIYRTTSTDLIHWTDLEKVVSQASVPDAVTYPDGQVWVYYQNFSEVCSSNNLRLAERAPITGRYEQADFSLSNGIHVKVSNEAFETNTALHYPTNGNPIALPDTAARDALDACMKTTAK